MDEGVTAAYDRIALAWRADRLGAADPFRERRFLDRLIAPLSPSASVLDVGCGCGEPVAAYLGGRGFRVTGFDGSAAMVELARAAVPAATFVLGDMRQADPGGPFDAVVAWDSVFHLPRADHPALFARLRGWLCPGGRLLLSLGGTGDEGFTSSMHGETFFYSGHDPEVALRLLSATGFAIEGWEVDDPSSRGHVAALAVRGPG
jgi:trans-aconitate methyltransferase